MTSNNGSTDLQVLFEEYLAFRESESAPDLEELFDRAGERRADLEKRIRFYEAIRRTANLMHGPEPSEPEADTDPGHLLDTLENYENLQRIGRGGQARVYKSYDSVLGRDVAIKFLRLERVAPGEVDRLLQAEAQALGRLTKPCVVTVHSFSKLGNIPYMVMEYVLAPTLREVLDAIRGVHSPKEDPRPDAEERAALLSQAVHALTPLPARIRFVAQIAEALEYCHTEGVLHRDIKPENILVALVEGQFVPRLVDFGLSFSDRRKDDSVDLSERFMVTLAYSAPEQLASERLGSSPKAEQFSLATVAYEFFTGIHPFEASGKNRGKLGVTRSSVLWATPPPMRSIAPEIPADLEAIVSHAHERDPETRYSRIGDLAQDLRALLDFRSISIQPTTVWGDSRRFLRRNRARILRWSLGTLLVLAGPIAMFVAQAKSARAEVRDEMNALRLDSEAWTKDWHFDEGWQRFGGLLARSSELDGELLWSWLFGSMNPVADRTGQSLSENMDKAIDQQIASRNPFQDTGDAILREVLELWKVPLALERASRPDALIRLDRPVDTLGSVFLSFGDEEALVQKQIAPDGFPLTIAFSPREAREVPGPGSYRYSSWDDPNDPIAKFEFDLALPTSTLPEPREFSRDRLDSMLSVEAFEREFFVIGGEDENGERLEGTVPLPYPIRGSAFYVSKVITWSDVARDLGKAEHDDLVHRFIEYAQKQENAEVPEALLQPDSPAFVGPEVAARYALATGARLPTASELFFAYEQGLLSCIKFPEDWNVSPEGELTGTYHPTNKMLCAIRPERISRNSILTSLNLVDPGRTRALLTFRIARTRATKAQLEKP